jgi:tRNA (guanine-N7-)-methyltransferase
MVRLRYTEISTSPFISHYLERRPLDWDKLFGRERPLDLEIGFGMGEFLYRHAQANSERNVIGIEQDWQRVKKTLRRIELQKGSSVQNIRVLLVDATVALERLFQTCSLDRVYCLFPCPWPKKAHVKHRLFSQEFLCLLNSRLKAKGEVQIVTDARPYQEWLLEQMQDTGFQVVARTIGPQFDTKYERKWYGLGQKEFYELLLIKAEHVQIPQQEDVELRVYHVERFRPEAFEFHDVAGATTVVCKEFLYDPAQRKAMTHLVVAERSITQHLWVIISPTAKGWNIAKAEGQTVLPTQGVAEAIRCVYDEVKRGSEIIK